MVVQEKVALDSTILPYAAVMPEHGVVEHTAVIIPTNGRRAHAGPLTSGLSIGCNLFHLDGV
jgi:hypothetical protein